jgi:cytochrome P450
MLIDRALVVSRNADIWTVDRNSERYAADRGGVLMWKFSPLDTSVGGKPAMLTVDGAKHRQQRAVMSKAFTPHMVIEEVRTLGIRIGSSRIATPRQNQPIDDHLHHAEERANRYSGAAMVRPGSPSLVVRTHHG